MVILYILFGTFFLYFILKVVFKISLFALVGVPAVLKDAKKNNKVLFISMMFTIILFSLILLLGIWLEVATN